VIGGQHRDCGLLDGHGVATENAVEVDQHRRRIYLRQREIAEHMNAGDPGEIENVLTRLVAGDGVGVVTIGEYKGVDTAVAAQKIIAAAAIEGVSAGPAAQVVGKVRSSGADAARPSRSDKDAARTPILPPSVESPGIPFRRPD
jgi:hypothetical protein